MMQTEEKVKTTTVGGRKRKHLVKFFLNDEEYLLHTKLPYGALTDNDAVGFYLKNNFSVTEFYETYGDETVLRYKCELNR